MPDTGTAAVLWRNLPAVALVARVAAWGRELGAAVVAVIAGGLRLDPDACGWGWAPRRWSCSRSPSS